MMMRMMMMTMMTGNVSESANVGQNPTAYLVLLYNLPTVPLGQVNVLPALCFSVISSHLSPLCSIYPMFRLLIPSPGDILLGAMFNQNRYKINKKRWIPWFWTSGTLWNAKRWSKKWYSNLWAMKFDLFHVGSTVQSRRVKESVPPWRIFPKCPPFLVSLGVVVRSKVVGPEKNIFINRPRYFIF